MWVKFACRKCYSGETVNGDGGEMTRSDSSSLLEVS